MVTNFKAIAEMKKKRKYVQAENDQIKPNTVALSQYQQQLSKSQKNYGILRGHPSTLERLRFIPNPSQQFQNLIFIDSRHLTNNIQTRGSQKTFPFVWFLFYNAAGSTANKYLLKVLVRVFLGL
jgi:hypothetical protein